MKYNKRLIYPLILQLFIFALLVTFSYFGIGASEFYSLLPAMLSAYVFTFAFVFLFIYFNEKQVAKIENSKEEK